jgi:4-hydroxybenzoate polyprenyltransferase
MTLVSIIISLRPKQQIKNLFLFSALIFGQKLTEPDAIFRVIIGFLLFCLTAGAGYIINDLIDIEKDRAHPIKRLRPIPAGILSKRSALIFVFFSLFSFPVSYILSPLFFITLSSYFLLTLLYSIYLKNIVIIDVIVVSLGFVLRVVAGAVVIPVKISLWLLICTMLLALFLALSKRRHEIVLLEEEASSHRTILSEYSPAFIDEMISAVTGAAIIAYSLYAFSPETQEKFGSGLPLTIPFVLYGIFRYLYLVHQKRKGGAPEIDITSDKPLMISIAGWIISILAIIYL